MSTIMLVDDSATILLSISNILTKAGYTVEKANNAAEGLAKFKSGVKVNLLITDLNMPGMNGIEFHQGGAHPAELQVHAHPVPHH
jgi:two-component system chemotaxis response regulator CheY